MVSCWGLCRRWGSSSPTGRVLGWVYLKQGSFLWSPWDTHSSCRDEVTLPVQKGPFCDIFTPRRKGTKITASMPAGVSYRGKCHRSQLALRQDRSCACQHCGEYRKPAWGVALLPPVRFLGMGRPCVDMALGDCVPLLDHLGPLSSDLPPSPALPCCLPLGLGQCWSQLILVYDFRSSRLVF